MRKGLPDQQDVEMRLAETICLYKGKAVYVMVDGACKKYQVNVRPLLNIHTQGEYIDHRDEQFQYKHLRVGYMQSGAGVTYMARLPERRMSEGIRPGALMSEPKMYGDEIFSKGFAQMLENDYPNVKQALNTLFTGQKNAVPIHYDVALKQVDDKTGVYYKARLVGFKEYDSDKFYLLNSREATYIRRIFLEIGLL